MELTELPVLGAGLGYRFDLHEQTLANESGVDFLELIGEHFVPLSQNRQLLGALGRRYACVPHCLNLSVGGDSAVDEAYVDAIREVSDIVDAPWVSDHLCFTEGDGIDFGHLTPLPWTGEAASAAARKAAYIQRRLGRPFLLENITYHFTMGGELSEAQFIEKVLDESGCGMLLDLNNVYTNSVNHGFDPVEFLAQLPLDRVAQMHIAGGKWHGDVLEDSHDAPVPEEVWRLVEFAVARSPVRAVLLERDDDFPPDFGALLGELGRARELLARPKLAPA